MFLHNVNQVVQRLVAEENLAFPVLNIALEIKRRRLVDSEIRESFWDSVAHFLGHAEKMVDRIATGKDNTRVFRKFDVLLSQLACGDIIQFDKLLKFEVHTILLHHLGIRRLRYVDWLWLRHQN